MRTCPRKNRMRGIRTSGSVRGEGEPLAYSTSVRQTDPRDLESATVCRLHPTLCDRKEKVAAGAAVPYNPVFGLGNLKGIVDEI